jgi:hypothetical protein
MSERAAVQLVGIRHRPSVLASFAAGLVMVGTLAALTISLQGTTEDESNGLPRIEGHGGGFLRSPSIGQLLGTAQVIIVGRVTAISGPEIVVPADPPDVPGPVRIYRVTYRVDAALRGDVGDELVVVDGEARGIPLFSARIGESQLILARRGRFGITPVYDGGQSVFRLTGRRTAVNQRGRSLDIADLHRRLPEATH